MENEEIRLLTEIDQRSRSNTKRLDRLERRQDSLEKLTETVATMQAELKNVLGAVSETKDAVKELQARPGRWWDRLLAAALTALVGFAFGLLTTKGA